MMLFLTRTKMAPLQQIPLGLSAIQLVQQNNTVFEELATFGQSSYNITGVGDPLRINGETDRPVISAY